MGNDDEIKMGGSYSTLHVMGYRINNDKYVLIFSLDEILIDIFLRLFSSFLGTDKQYSEYFHP